MRHCLERQLLRKRKYTNKLRYSTSASTNIFIGLSFSAK